MSRLLLTFQFPALLALFLFLLPFIAALPVLAHNPIFGEKNSDYAHAIRIPDPDISYAMYGYLDTPGAARFYFVDVETPVTLMTQMNVPKNDVYATFRPSYAIVGPGIAAADPMPFGVPVGNGSRLINATRQAPWSEFYEPFSGITYHMSVKTYTTLEVPGRYYIAIFDEGQKKGDYVLATGERESFSIRDLPGVIWKVIQLRLGWLDHSRDVAPD